MMTSLPFLISYINNQMFRSAQAELNDVGGRHFKIGLACFYDGIRRRQVCLTKARLSVVRVKLVSSAKGGSGKTDRAKWPKSDNDSSFVSAPATAKRQHLIAIRLSVFTGRRWFKAIMKHHASNCSG